MILIRAVRTFFGHISKNSCHSRSANRILPQEFKVDISYPTAHILLPGTRVFRFCSFDMCCCSVILFPCWHPSPGAILTIYSELWLLHASYIPGGITQRVIFAKTKGFVTITCDSQQNHQNQNRMLKLKIKFLMISFFLLFNKEMETRDICKMQWGIVLDTE